MKHRPRILFVCFADSTHSQSWMRLLKDGEFKLRVFATPVRNLFGSASHQLRQIIQKWRPAIVHTLRLYPEGKLTWQALEGIEVSQRPAWIISSWGREFEVGVNYPEPWHFMQQALRDCDAFMADCRRDIELAMTIGLAPTKVAFRDGVPGTGGLQLEQFSPQRYSLNGRNLIVIPKAFEGEFNKTLPILEALGLLQDVLDKCEIHLTGCSVEVKRYLTRMSASLRERCRCYPVIPQKELFAMFEKARVMIATSIADGTPNVMLEAMAAGALPVMSPLASIQEWIEDGRNGLLADALYPDQIARALKRALTDNELFEQAKDINWKLVSERANRALIRPQVLDFYRQLVNRRKQSNNENFTHLEPEIVGENA